MSPFSAVAALAAATDLGCPSPPDLPPEAEISRRVIDRDADVVRSDQRGRPRQQTPGPGRQQRRQRSDASVLAVCPDEQIRSVVAVDIEQRHLVAEAVAPLAALGHFRGVWLMLLA